MLLASVLTTLVAWQTGQRATGLEETVASTLQAVEQNTEVLTSLRREEANESRSAQAAPSRFAERASPNPAELQQADTELPNAAELLVTEIQSMGILGPIRIETTAGSFCVKAAPQGFNLVGNNLSLWDCEALPVQMSANR